MTTPQPAHGTVLPEWIDHNGHMNVAYYVLAFDLSLMTFFDEFGLDQNYRDSTGCSTFTGDLHIYYKRELHEGDDFTVTHTLLGFDEKRIRYMSQMHRADDGSEVAIQEAISLHVDLTERRVCPMREPLVSGLIARQARQGPFTVPPEIGRTIEKPRIFRGGI